MIRRCVEGRNMSKLRTINLIFNCDSWSFFGGQFTSWERNRVDLLMLLLLSTLASGSVEEDLDSDEEDDEDDSENSDEDLSGDLVFPKSYTKALIQLLEAEDPIPVRDIKLSSKEEKVGLAYSLWDEGLISTDIQHKPKPVKRVKLWSCECLDGQCFWLLYGKCTGLEW